MYLRNLKIEDASFMLEWMNDDDVILNLSTQFNTKNLQDCENFILASMETSINLHMAIASDDDEYMGTVSLKHIDKVNENAEFAITVRKSAIGKGYAWFGMIEIIRIAFEKLGLNSMYWCVSKKNVRACRFYDKHGFHETSEIPNEILARYEGVEHLKWYSVLNNDDYQNEAMMISKVNGCKKIKIKTIPTVDAGELSFFEANHDISFDIRRIYYISKVPEGVKRGCHAHKELKQLLFCPYGRIQLILDDGQNREEITLCDPSIGIVIERPIWREMLWIEKDSVLFVAASDFYSEEDYIRDYNEFLNHTNLGGAK